jgi:hypothetical protein
MKRKAFEALAQSYILESKGLYSEADLLMQKVAQVTQEQQQQQQQPAQEQEEQPLRDFETEKLINSFYKELQSLNSITDEANEVYELAQSSGQKIRSTVLKGAKDLAAYRKEMSRRQSAAQVQQQPKTAPGQTPQQTLQNLGIKPVNQRIPKSLLNQFNQAWDKARRVLNPEDKDVDLGITAESFVAWLKSKKEKANNPDSASSMPMQNLQLLQ